MVARSCARTRKYGEAIGVDAAAAGGLVVAQARREVGEPLERVAHQDPREVVVEVAPVRQLPVGDRDQLGARVHEVAGAGVALHQHHRPVTVVGHLRPQPRERERDHGHAAAGRVVLRLPLGDLVEDVLTDRTGHTQLGQVERVRVEAVQRGQLLHELLGHCELLVGIGDLGEAAGALDPRHQERGLGGMGGDERGDTHGRRTEGAVHGGFPRQ